MSALKKASKFEEILRTNKAIYAKFNTIVIQISIKFVKILKHKLCRNFLVIPRFDAKCDVCEIGARPWTAVLTDVPRLRALGEFAKLMKVSCQLRNRRASFAYITLF